MGGFEKHKRVFADLGLLYAAAIWGSTFFIVKDSLKSIDPVVLVSYRFLIAALILGLFLVFKGKKLFENFSKGLLLGIFIWLLYVPQTIGLKYTTASNSGFITGLFILFVPLFSYIFSRKLPKLSKYVSLMLALAGLWFLTGGLKLINIGDLLTLIAAAAYGIHIIFGDRFSKLDFDPYVLSFQQFLVVGVLSLAAAVLFNLPLRTSTNALGIVLFLALFPTLSAFVIQLVAQKITSPFKVAVIFSMEPVFGAVFAWTLGGEIFHAKNAIGGLFIVCAMIVSEISE